MACPCKLFEAVELSSAVFLGGLLADCSRPEGFNDYLMLKNLKVSNFRCFKELHLENLRHVNVVVGRNAAGKTAVLEAIKVGLDASPGVMPWLNQNRNIPTVLPANPSGDQFQDLFRDFFYDFDIAREIEIWMQDSQQATASLRIYFDPKKAITTQMSIGFQRVPASVPNTIVPLAFERLDFNNQKSTAYATTKPDGMMFFEPVGPMGPHSGFFPHSHFGNPPESAAWLSNLNVQKRGDEVVDAIRRHFPFIKGLTSETPFPGIGGTVYADIPALPRRIPLSLVSGGISRLFSFVLAIVTLKGGVVFIDEIENGIFYDQYPLVWKTIIDLADDQKTQLFITTHSNECLQALLPILSRNERDFSLLRVEKENGTSHVAQFTGKEFEDALGRGGEIRSK